MRPDISVLIPARNEGDRLAPTIRSIARARTTDARVEFVVVDDASTDGCGERLAAAAESLLEEPRIDVRLTRLESHGGIYRARNRAATLARGDVLFITDAHVQFSRGWDACVVEHVRADRILAGTTGEFGTRFRGYGCRLVVPFMGTRWNGRPDAELAPVQVAACSATVLPRALFAELGGYDEAMVIYGGGEPEFSVRAWLHGAEIVGVASLEVAHRFKPKGEYRRFMATVRPYWVHNCLRFGLLYLSEPGCMQLLRHHAQKSPHFQKAVRMIEAGDVWERRRALERRRVHPFEWFVRHFELRNQVGGPII